MTLGALMRSVVMVGMVMLFTACDKDKEMSDDDNANGALPFCESLIGSYTDTPTSEDMVRIAARCPSQTDWTGVSLSRKGNPGFARTKPEARRKTVSERNRGDGMPSPRFCIV